MKSFFELTLTNKQRITLSGVELINIAQKVYKNIYSILYGTPQVPKITEIIILKNPLDWLWLPQAIYDNSRATPAISDLRIQITPDGPFIAIKGHQKRFVVFPENKGSYYEICDRLKAIIGLEVDSDSSEPSVIIPPNMLSIALSKRLLLQPYPPELKDHTEFLDALLILLFVVEPSRHYPAFLYSFFLLDLITLSYGRRWTWDNAFTSEKNYRYDDWEHQDIGGKYPMATKSTGSGNFIEANNLLRDFNENIKEAMLKILSQPQHHAVLTKGMTLLINWLLIFMPDELTCATDRYDFQLKLEYFFSRYLIEKLNVTISSHPNLTTRFRDTPPVKTVAPGRPLSELLSEMQVSPHGATNIQVLNDIPGKYYEHTSDRSMEKKKFYFHRQGFCKLVPEYVQHGYSKSIGLGKESRHLTAKIFDGLTVRQGREADLHPCPYCFRSNFSSYKKSHVDYWKKSQDIMTTDYSEIEHQATLKELVRYHIKYNDQNNIIPTEERTAYLLLCQGWLTKRKRWSSSQRCIIKICIENLRQHFLELPIPLELDENRLSKIYRYIIVENILIRLFNILPEIFAPDDLKATYQALLIASIQSHAGIPCLVDKEQFDNSYCSMELSLQPLPRSTLSEYSGIKGLMHCLIMVGNKAPYLKIEPYIVALNPWQGYSTEEYEAHLRLLIADQFGKVAHDKFSIFFSSTLPMLDGSNIPEKYLKYYDYLDQNGLAPQPFVHFYQKSINPLQQILRNPAAVQHKLNSSFQLCDLAELTTRLSRTSYLLANFDDPVADLSIQLGLSPLTIEQGLIKHFGPFDQIPRSDLHVSRLRWIENTVRRIYLGKDSIVKCADNNMNDPDKISAYLEKLMPSSLTIQPTHYPLVLLQFLYICTKNPNLYAQCTNCHVKLAWLQERHTFMAHLHALFILFATLIFPDFSDTHSENTARTIFRLIRNSSALLKDKQYTTVLFSMYATVYPIQNPQLPILPRISLSESLLKESLFKWLHKFSCRPYVRLAYEISGPYLTMDLSYFDLRGMDLSGLLFSMPDAISPDLAIDANFCYADLRGANLQNSRFRSLESVHGARFDLTDKHKLLGSNIEELLLSTQRMICS